MRLIKMFGLAAIAVGAFMAFLGATSASAVTSLEEVVLCKNNESPCLATNRFASGTVLHAELVAGTEAVLHSWAGDVLCSTSTTLGATNSTLAQGEITALSFGGCVLDPEKQKCTVTPEHLNYVVKGELKSTDSGYEILVTERSPNGRPQAHVECPGTVVNCHYGASNVLFEELTVAGDTVLDVSQNLTALSGVDPLACFTTSPAWEAKYLTRCLSGTSLVACYLRME